MTIKDNNKHKSNKQTYNKEHSMADKSCIQVYKFSYLPVASKVFAAQREAFVFVDILACSSNSSHWFE